MKYTIVLQLHGVIAEAVAVEWTELDAPGHDGTGWEPCIRLPDGRWRFASREDSTGLPHLRDPGVFSNIAIRYRLEPGGPWSEISDRKEITIIAEGDSPGGETGEDKAPLPALPVLIGGLMLVGSGKIGSPVIAAPGTWTGATNLAFQWCRDGAEIRGATAPEYVPVAEDDLTELTCRITATGPGGRVEATSAALLVTHVAPVAKGELLDEIFDQGSGVQLVAAAGDFTGEALVFSVEGADATIDAATGVVAIPTDVPLSGEIVTVTATNSGGSAASGFPVTVEEVEESPRPKPRPTTWNPFPAEQLKDAMGRPLSQYSLSGNYLNAAWFGQAALTLALNSYAGDTSSDARLASQIGRILTGNRQPGCEGGYTLQHDCRILSTLAVARHIPRIWDDELTSSGRAAIRALAKAGLVTGLFMSSDHNPYVAADTQERTLRGDTNTARNWNPNYRLANPTAVCCAIALLGEEYVFDYVADYNHDALVRELEATGLSNTHAVFARTWGSNTPSAAQIEQAVRQFRRYDHGIEGYRNIAIRDTNGCFSREVHAGLNGGRGVWDSRRNMYRGRIMSGAEGLPNRGAVGMCFEFDTVDGGGPRSSFHYCLDGARLAIEAWVTLAVAGLIDRTDPAMVGIRNRMNIGYTDLDYKWKQGYYSYSKGGQGGGNEDWTIASHGEQHGRSYSMGLWFDVFRPWFFG